MSKKKSVIDTAEKVWKKHGYKCSKSKNSVSLELCHDGRKNVHRVVVGKKSATFRTDFSEDVDEPRRLAVAGILMALNKEVGVGFYGIDMDSGRVSFSTQIPKARSGVSNRDIMYHTTIGLEMIGILEDYLDLDEVSAPVSNEEQEYGFADPGRADCMFG